MTSVLESVSSPADLRGLDEHQLAQLATEIRDLLVASVSANASGHLGPNLGIVEVTIALHRVFDSPTEPILFDVGHQAYVHKILTGRAGPMSGLRQTGGLSGYPNRAESEHDWVENSHASTALSYADGLAKAFDVRGARRPVVAVVGDGALTGGMCWEALNNIAASDRPVVIVVNDNGRSYSPTIGALAERLAGLRLRPGYEKTLDRVKGALGRTPVVGPPVYEALHGVKRGIKDMLAPQGMFEDLGLKYVGPIDGHDLAALEHAFALARDFGGPVLVHCSTRKGFGYPPAENDEADQLHQWRPLDPETGKALPSTKRTWTSVFADELLPLGHERSDVVAITAAMSEPDRSGRVRRRCSPNAPTTSGSPSSTRSPQPPGMAMGGMHPVVAVYATFLNRAFDQVLIDVALHRLPVTFVLDRAGLTGDDGASHNGMWDLALSRHRPRAADGRAARRSHPARRVREAMDHADGPTDAALPQDRARGRPGRRPPRRRLWTCCAEPEPEPRSRCCWSASARWRPTRWPRRDAIEQAGYAVRVVDPRWVNPLTRGLVELADQARLVVTVEDGVATGGVGRADRSCSRAAGVTDPHPRDRHARRVPRPRQGAGRAAAIGLTAARHRPPGRRVGRRTDAGPTSPRGRDHRRAARPPSRSARTDRPADGSTSDSSALALSAAAAASGCTAQSSVRSATARRPTSARAAGTASTVGSRAATRPARRTASEASRFCASTVCSAASAATTSRQRASRSAATGSRSRQRPAGGTPSPPLPSPAAVLGRQGPRLGHRRPPALHLTALPRAAEDRQLAQRLRDCGLARAASRSTVRSGSSRPGAMSRSAAYRSRACHSDRTTASWRGPRTLWMPDVRRQGPCAEHDGGRRCGRARTPAAPTRSCPRRPAPRPAPRAAGSAVRRPGRRRTSQSRGSGRVLQSAAECSLASRTPSRTRPSCRGRPAPRRATGRPARCRTASGAQPELGQAGQILAGRVQDPFRVTDGVG